MKKKSISSLLFPIAFLLINSFFAKAQQQAVPKQLRIGYSISITDITPDKMKYAKSVGIDCIEIAGISGLIEKGSRNFKLTHEGITKLMKQAKKAADDAGIEIWSVHMPFSKEIDLSMKNETERIKVVAVHKKVLEYCSILHPKIILFHPSYYLELNEREARKKQFIKSARDLNKTVKTIKATMVIENMLGPELWVADGKRERPLCRTIEETVEIMNRLPNDIYSAIDMNHIKNPEKLILAMGSRLKSVHIADGDGLKERHYFPCSKQGENNWVEILSALGTVQYTGPFMFESAYKDVKDIKECYDVLFTDFINEKY